MKKIKINKDFFFSNEEDLKFILGPCQIESKSHAFDICSEIDKLSKKLDFKYVQVITAATTKIMAKIPVAQRAIFQLLFILR